MFDDKSFRSQLYQLQPAVYDDMLMIYWSALEKAFSPIKEFEDAFHFNLVRELHDEG